VQPHPPLVTTRRPSCGLWRALTAANCRTAPWPSPLEAPRKPAAWSVPFLGDFLAFLPSTAQGGGICARGPTASCPQQAGRPSKVAMAASEGVEESSLILTSPCGLVRMSKAQASCGGTADERHGLLTTIVYFCARSSQNDSGQRRNCSSVSDSLATLEAALRLLLIRQVAGRGWEASGSEEKTLRQQAGRVGD